MTTDTRLTITLDDGTTTITALRTPARSARWTFIYAPGAGANLNDPFGQHLARTLPAIGITTVRFQFPYMEAGRKSPDRPAVLEATWRAVINEIRGTAAPGRARRTATAAGDQTKLCVGGRSMGGRIASMVVAEGVPVDALALFAYPLHPPGKPMTADAWRGLSARGGGDGADRTEHLRRIKTRTLFVSGTRDAFASPDELRAAAKLIRRDPGQARGRAILHLLDAADHGYNVPKSTGRTREDTHAEATTALTTFLTQR